MSYIVFFSFFFLSQSAYAYLDPGTGSLILQMIIAGILSTLFAIKMYWYRLKSFFKDLFDRKKIDPDDEENHS